MSEQELLFPIIDKKQYIFAKNNIVNMYMDNSYIQAYKAEQSSSSIISNNIYFNNKFYVPYNLSISGIYNSFAKQLTYITENNYNDISNQKYIGIWKTKSITAGENYVPEQTERIQFIALSNYYYNDEIKNGSLRIYYLPIIDSTTSSLSSLQSQNVYKNFDINKDYFGASFSVTGTVNTLKTNLTGTSTGFSVELFFRPVPQKNSGYFFHRWTTNSLSSVITNYNNSISSLTSDYPFYSANEFYGVGAKFNYLLPYQDSDNEIPSIDFYVFGDLPSTTSHYLNLYNNRINNQTHTRFNLSQNILNILFDGGFHSIRFVWSIEEYYKYGRIYIDNIELQRDFLIGDGRTTPVSYILSSNSITLPYFFSHQDNTENVHTQYPTKYPTYCEAKHIVVFNRPISGNTINQSITSNNQLFSSFGSLTSDIGLWFGFNSVTSQTTAVDLVSQFAIKPSSLTGRIINDNSSSVLEGKIDRIYSLLYDKHSSFANSLFDESATSETFSQKIVGKIYNSEYGTSASQNIGYVFYDKGIIGILNDEYNTNYNKSTQLFVSSTSSYINTSSSSDNWKIEYISFAGTQYTNRLLLTITADANYFCKSRNNSSLFKGTDQNIYTKMNTKTINGIVWYDKNGMAVAQTKFSKPIIKKEHNSIIIQTNIDL